MNDARKVYVHCRYMLNKVQRPKWLNIKANSASPAVPFVLMQKSARAQLNARIHRW